MQEIKQLLEITQKLRNEYKRGFSLDGRLVGDIGEFWRLKNTVWNYTEKTLQFMMVLR